MIVSHPVSFAEAVRLLAQKQIVPTQLDTAALSTIEAAIRRYSTFSATVTNGRYLQEIADVVSRVVDPRTGGGAPGSSINRATARTMLRDYLARIGYAAAPGEEGTIKDLSSDARLDLVVRTNTELAQGYGQHVQANSPGVLDAFPCAELFRLEPRMVPRQWPQRWRAAGGHFYGPDARMIARKDDPVWIKISRFGNPYPPFDFNSGMWVKPVPRALAIRLGVIAPDERVQSSPVAFAPPPEIDLTRFTAGLREVVQESLENTEK